MSCGGAPRVRAEVRCYLNVISATWPPEEVATCTGMHRLQLASIDVDEYD